MIKDRNFDKYIYVNKDIYIHHSNIKIHKGIAEKRIYIK